MSIAGISSSSSSSSNTAIVFACSGSTLVEGAELDTSGIEDAFATFGRTGGMSLDECVAGANFGCDGGLVAIISGWNGTGAGGGASAGEGDGDLDCITADGKFGTTTTLIGFGAAVAIPNSSRTAASSWLSSARNRDKASTCGSERTSGGTLGCSKSSSLR